MGAIFGLGDKMKVEIMYAGKATKVKSIIDAMAKDVKTHIKSIHEYSHEVNDLVVLAFDDSFKSDQELKQFIQSLHRDQVKNLCLVCTFYHSNKKMEKVIELCQRQRLPLLREQYAVKLPLFSNKAIPNSCIDSGRIYIDNMVTIVQQYY